MKVRKYHTPPGYFVVREAAEYIAKQWGQGDIEDEIQRHAAILWSDIHQGKLNIYKHGPKERIKMVNISDLQQYLPNEIVQTTNPNINNSFPPINNDESQYKQSNPLTEIKTLIDLTDKNYISIEVAMKGIKDIISKTYREKE